MKKVRQIDIAHEVGASVSTVSKALTGRADVSASLRRKIVDAASRLGYEAPPSAPPQGRTIHAVADDMRNFYTPMVLSGLLAKAAELGYTVALHLKHDPGPGERPGSTAWIHRAADDGAAGLVLITMPTSEVDLVAAERRGFPIVLIGPIQDTPSGVYSVGSTNWQGGRQGTQYLVGLGHTRIGVVAGQPTSRPARERVQGYRSVLEEAGIGFDPDLVFYDSFRYESALAGMRYLLGLTPPPTAVFALSDQLALGVLDSCRRRNLTVPGDVSLVGFDDGFGSRSFVPALTTVRQPLEAMGAAAITFLADAGRGSEPDWPRYQLETQLVIRDSAAPLAK